MTIDLIGPFLAKSKRIWLNTGGSRGRVLIESHLYEQNSDEVAVIEVGIGFPSKMEPSNWCRVRDKTIVGFVRVDVPVVDWDTAGESYSKDTRTQLLLYTNVTSEGSATRNTVEVPS